MRQKGLRFLDHFSALLKAVDISVELSATRPATMFADFADCWS